MLGLITRLKGLGLTPPICINSLCKRLFGAYFSQDYAQDPITYVHNRFVEMLLETGLLGFVPFVIFLVILCFSHFKQFIKSNDIFALLFLLSQVIYWTLGFFQFSIWEIWIFPIFAINLIFIKALREEVK